MSESELIKVSGGDDAGRDGDVVFVHGLGGNPRDYWSRDGTPELFWPAWLGQDLPRVGVWSLGYEVEKFAWKGHAMPLADRATNALALLDVKGIGQRPLVFVTHSMGGLLVKQMIRHGLDYGDPRWRAIAEQTRGICFLSTPHSGSDIATWVNFIGVLRPTVAVEDLRAHDPRLRELNTWYRNRATSAGIRTEAYCEKLPTGRGPFRAIVVNETTADPGIPGVNPIPMDDDHLTICRPASRNSLLYERVVRFVRECLANPRLAHRG